MSSWKYAPYENEDGTLSVCEYYTGLPGGSGWTGPISPVGDDLSDLGRELKMMRKDIKAWMGPPLKDQKTLEQCPACDTPMPEAPGIGPYCPNEDCEVLDDAALWEPEPADDLFSDAGLDIACPGCGYEGNLKFVPLDPRPALIPTPDCVNCGMDWGLFRLSDLQRSPWADACGYWKGYAEADMCGECKECNREK